jgi:hypothetical protein
MNVYVGAVLTLVWAVWNVSTAIGEAVLPAWKKSLTVREISQLLINVVVTTYQEFTTYRRADPVQQLPPGSRRQGS